MTDWSAIVSAAIAGVIGILVGAALMVIAPNQVRDPLERIADTVWPQAQLVAHSTAVATPAQPLANASPTPTPATRLCFAVPQYQYRTPAVRSESDQQRWRAAEIRCRSQPPITGNDAFRLLNMARRLSAANDEADRCWSLVMALPGGEEYLAEAPHALMSGDTNWSEVYRSRFAAKDEERQRLQDQMDALIRELCRKHYNESECVAFTDDQTGEQHLCPLTLGNPGTTASH
ncbi:MAG TPA: hypothetical protein VL403_20790 [Candidatus Kryptonia bacterium]|nr:hypothetical protein [Candidatus Kryptonia bacterium]